MSVSTDEFKNVMAAYPTGVCVVTTETDTHAPFGMTINSFTSLSLVPPLVMWNLQKQSDTFRAWRDTENFAVNMLRAGQGEISRRFAMRDNHDLDPSEFLRGKSGCPVLEDCLGSLECTMHARHEEGDHVILIGEVIAVYGPTDLMPLTYHNRGYGTVASD